jgi:hypothetical protein
MLNLPPSQGVPHRSCIRRGKKAETTRIAGGFGKMNDEFLVACLFLRGRGVRGQ